nr:putative reverse transcriptase domain-containing protein [Tanacetum cinerariifolium]
MQRELFSDYDYRIRYHLGKPNVVADALSRKERVKPKRVRAMIITLQSCIKDRILQAQKEAVNESIGLQKAHKSEYFVHLGADKMYYDLKDRYWWPGMKKDIAEKCHSPIMWAEVREGQLIGPELVKRLLRRSRRLRIDLRLRKGVVCFGKKGKFAPRFVRLFKIVEKVGPVANRLDLPEELNGVHDMFHVSNLKKCLADPTLQVPLDEIQVDAKLNFMEEPVKILEREFKKMKRSRIVIVKFIQILYRADGGDFMRNMVRERIIEGPEMIEICADLSYIEEPEAILDHQDRVMRNKTILFVKTLWRNYPEREATWETK